MALAGHPGREIFGRPLQDAEHAVHALWLYEQTRLPMTAEIVRSNRRGGPEGVIDAVEERAPDGFSNIDDVLSFEQRKAIVAVTHPRRALRASRSTRPHEERLFRRPEKNRRRRGVAYSGGAGT